MVAYNISVNDLFFKYKARINISLENCFLGGVPFMMEKRLKLNLSPYNFEVDLLRIVIAPFFNPGNA